MTKQTFFLLLCIASLVSCEKDFVIQDQALRARMVVNSMFSNTGKMNVYVTSSYAASGSNPIKALDDAIVEVYEDNVFKEQLKFVNSDSVGTFGKFQTTFNPVKGKKYSIKVTQSQFGQADATDEQVIPVQITGNYVTYYPSDSTDNANARVKVAIHDNADKENFYKISFWINEQYIEGITTQGDTIIVSCNAYYTPTPITYLTDTTREWGQNLFFSDNNFNGQDKELEFELPAVRSKDKLLSSKLWIEVVTASKTYYNYYKTLELYRQTNNANSSEPSYVYSNINNGYGIFASYNMQRKSLIIK
jgi:hypothetical protein